MNKEQIISMAREAGLVGGPVYARGLERFAELVRADEREACAQSLDKQADLACDAFDRKWAQEMAAAVRARSKT